LKVENRRREEAFLDFYNFLGYQEESLFYKKFTRGVEVPHLGLFLTDPHPHQLINSNNLMNINNASIH
jgi:hypothetical protein